MPVVTYLAINSMTRKHMILIFEENVHFQVGTDDQQSGFGNSAYMLANSEYKMAEVSSNFHDVTGVQPVALKHLSNQLDR